MKILITGGTGFIGRFLTQKLLADGHEITLLSRNPRKNKNTPSLDYIAFETVATDENIAKIKAADIVINLAGENIGDKRWTADRKEELITSRVNITRTIVELMNRNPKKTQRLISASAVGFYGPHGNATITEENPAGADFLSRVCVAWENEARAFSKAEENLVILRIGVVLHPSLGALTKMALPIKFFIGGKLGRGRQFISWIHIDDLIDLFKFIIDDPQLAGVFNATAPVPVSNAEMTRAIAATLHRPALFPVPGFVLKLILGEQAELVLQGQRVLPARLTGCGFGFKFCDINRALADLYL